MSQGQRMQTLPKLLDLSAIRADRRRRRDPLRAARGIRNGIVISAALWGLILAATWFAAGWFLAAGLGL